VTVGVCRCLFICAQSYMLSQNLHTLVVSENNRNLQRWCFVVLSTSIIIFFWELLGSGTPSMLSENLHTPASRSFLLLKIKLGHGMNTGHEYLARSFDFGAANRTGLQIGTTAFANAKVSAWLK